MAWATIALWLAGARSSAADDAGRPVARLDESRQVDFATDVLPVLRKSCLACHNESETEGELILESVDTITAGGDSGQVIVPGNADESLLFQLATHRMEPFMPPADNDVGAKPLNPDQLALLKGWIDQGAKVGTGGTRKEIQWKPVADEFAPTYALDVSGDGRLLAAGRGNRIMIYSIPGKRELARLVDPGIEATHPGAAHLDIVQSVAFSPDARTIVSGGYRCIKVWRRDPAVEVSRLALYEGIKTVASNGDGSRLAVLREGAAELRDSSGAELAKSALERLVAVVFAGENVVAASQNGELHLLSGSDLSVRQSWLPQQDQPVTLLAADERGDTLVTSAGGAKADSWKLSDGKYAITGTVDAGGELRQLAVSPDGTRLLTIDAAGEGKLWDLGNRKLIKQYTGDIFSASTLATVTRDVGLRKERHRVATEDVDQAKKRKDDDEKNAKKSAEDLEKARAEVPKKQEALAKAEAEAKQPEEEFSAANQQVEELKGQVAKLDEQLKAAPDAEQKRLQEEKQKVQAVLQQAEQDLANKKQAQEKAEKQTNKARQEVEAVEKAVTLAEESKQRAEQAVELRTKELAEAEAEAQLFADKLKSAEGQAETARQAAASHQTPLLHVVFSDVGLALLQAGDGHLASISSETGELLDEGQGPRGQVISQAQGIRQLLRDDAIVRYGVSPSWTLIKVIGYPADETVFADRVTALAFNHDGSLLATGGGEPSRSGEVELWNVADWTRVASLPDVHSDVVYDLQFSPQDDLLASCGSDRMMKLTDLAEAKAIRSFEGHTGHVLGVAWRADGRSVATAGADKVIKVWDAKEGTQKKTVSGFNKEVTGVRYLGLEDRFVFTVGDGQVQSRNSNGDGRPAFSGYADYIHRISSSLDGEIVAAAGQDGVIRVWAKDGTIKAEFKR